MELKAIKEELRKQKVRSHVTMYIYVPLELLQKHGAVLNKLLPDD
jgi:hypothetical protein